mmetsp:Transcript_95597/g.187672  ORF Transcript_95597/g.187672 Transcript_95597/m.187672 type:complete len:102 (+) Transcript_95597:235-540(+)
MTSGRETCTELEVNMRPRRHNRSLRGFRLLSCSNLIFLPPHGRTEYTSPHHDERKTQQQVAGDAERDYEEGQEHDVDAQVIAKGLLLARAWAEKHEEGLEE